MKITSFLFIIFFLLSTAFAQTYEVDRYVIGSGGGHIESSTYKIDGTIGQPIVGLSTSENFTVEAGFWVGAGRGDFCYEYLPGDANMAAGMWPPAAVGNDVTYLVNYFRGLQAACLIGGFYSAADVNGSCSITGGDVTLLVNYFRSLSDLYFCPDYEPCWLSTGDLSADPPSGWPNCETPPLSSGE